MVSFGRHWSVFAIMVLLVFVSGCDEDGNREGMVEPLPDEPVILESVMCLDIDDARPVGITDTFFESDDRIYIWMYWSSVETPSTVEVLWFEPGAELSSDKDSQIIDSSTGYAIAWFSIDEPVGGFKEGDWSVDIYLDDLFERSHLFTVLDD